MIQSVEKSLRVFLSHHGLDGLDVYGSATALSMKSVTRQTRVFSREIRVFPYHYIPLQSQVGVCSKQQMLMTSSLQSKEVKRTPQEYINELIIAKLNPLVESD